MHILLTYFFGQNEVQKNIFKMSCYMQGNNTKFISRYAIVFQWSTRARSSQVTLGP